MLVRALSTELQAKAISELQENPNRVKDDIQSVKQWLRKQPHLNPKLDDQLILTYLRGCKYSLEKTKSKLDSSYALKSMLPEFFLDRNPFDKGIQILLKTGVILPLKSASPTSPIVIITRPGPLDPTTVKLSTLYKLHFMIMDILLSEDDQAVISGVVAFFDMTGITISNIVKYMDAALTKKMIGFYYEGRPVRPKEMHFYNMPSICDTLLGTIKPLLKKKIQQRIYAHRSSKIEDMYQYISKSILPTEYGGDAGPLQDLIDYWKEKVESYADWYKDDSQFTSDESRRIGRPKTVNDTFGIEGSFRKLDVD